MMGDGRSFGRTLFAVPAMERLLVEPVPYCAEMLSRLYSDRQRFAIEQVAVGDTAGSATFYYVSEHAKDAIPELPDWYDQLGSFDRSHIVRHLDGALEPFIVSVEVELAPLSEIVQRHGMSEVTLLHVDTEGYDLAVLKGLGMPSICPSWIMIEHRHLAADDRKEMIGILVTNGYDVFDCGGDYFAIHRRATNGMERMAQLACV